MIGSGKRKACAYSTVLARLNLCCISRLLDCVIMIESDRHAGRSRF